MNIRSLFEDELTRRRLTFTIDVESDRHAVEVGGGQMLVSLENLRRDVENDGDIGRIARFVDAIEAAAISDGQPSPDQLFWSLEPSDYEPKADFRVALSDRVDRVLVHLAADGRLVTWVTPAMLSSLALSEAEAATKAFANLAQALRESTIEVEDIDGVQVGFLATRLPFKASMILAPNLREVTEPLLGWPLMAVTPDRDFLYFWCARNSDFAGRVGSVVAREYMEASYPVSTEVYEITGEGIVAIGAFPIPS